MSFFDVLIAAIVFLTARRWAQRGFVKGAFSLLGFWAGLYAGALLAPVLVDHSDDAFSRMAIALLTVLGLAFIGGAAGDWLGYRLTMLAHRFQLHKVNAALGAAFGGASTLLVVWLVATMLSGTPFPNLNRQIRDSFVMRAMDQSLPPAPAVLARLGSVVNPLRFPQVFVGQGPRPAKPVGQASSSEVSDAVRQARRSTVKIESLGCGGVLNGSGFVAADGFVVTNAHVVAGVRQIVVEDEKGLHRARPVFFDAAMDIAVLSVDGLAGPPLVMVSADVPRGTKGAVMGYPGGGDFTAVPAGVLRQMHATGLDIYGRRIAARDVYELQAKVEQGNSGGPVVLPDGRVIGVVFARSENEAQTGYAIVSHQVIPRVRQAQDSDREVGTGVCTAD